MRRHQVRPGGKTEEDKMARRRGISLAVGLFIALMACTPACRAQAPRGGGGAPGGPSGDGPSSRPLANVGGWAAGGSASLLTNPSVQKELKLTEKQKTQIKQLSDDLTRKDQETFKGALNPGGSFELEALADAITQNGAETIRRGLMERQFTRPQEVESAIARILTPRQRSRLAQIALQIEGLWAVTRPEVASRLNMSPDQVEQIGMILVEMGEAQKQLRMAQRERLMPLPDLGEGDGDQDKQVKQLRQYLERTRRDSDRLRERALREIGRVLTRRQRAAFAKLLGEPFDLSPVRPGDHSGPGARRDSRGTASGDQPASVAPDSAADPGEQPRRPERQPRKRRGRDLPKASDKPV
jgi:Spy/CpxP family protein refolding chaperone